MSGACVRRDGDTPEWSRRADLPVPIRPAPPARSHSRAQVRRRSCGASLAMSASAAACLTISRGPAHSQEAPRASRGCAARAASSVFRRQQSRSLPDVKRLTTASFDSSRSGRANPCFAAFAASRCAFSSANRSRHGAQSAGCGIQRPRHREHPHVRGAGARVALTAGVTRTNQPGISASTSCVNNDSDSCHPR